MILVTGGTGLVGAHLLLDLVKNEDTIRAIYRKNGNLNQVKKVFSYYCPKEELPFLFGKIEWVEADLVDVPALTSAFEGITKVYHCAALVSFKSRDAAALRKINIEGTANIVNLSISFKIKKICYISSIATMDVSAGDKYITENFTWYPEKDHSDYAISKHGAEIEIWRGSQEGVPVVILNPGIILGPGFWNKGTGQFFTKVAKGLNYYFKKTSGFVGVQDVSRFAVMAMDSLVKNEQYIVVAENMGFRTVLDLVATELGKRPPQKELKSWMIYAGWVLQTMAQLFGAEKQINKRDYKSLFDQSFYSNEKIKKDFSFEFTPMNEVISQTAGIFKNEVLN